MKHCCEHECQHLQVKYCQGCKNIYCVSCKQKWEEPCKMAHSYPWTYTTFGATGSSTSDTVYIRGAFASSDCAVHQ